MFLYVVIGLCSFIVGGVVVGLYVMFKMDKPPIGAINIFIMIMARTLIFT